MATNVLEARGGSLVPPVAQRGYHIVYRDHETNYCPGCGRTTSTVFQELAKNIEQFLRDQMPVWKSQYAGVEEMRVAVMGCVVNGPGESKHADIGISLPGTGEVPVAPVYVDGKKTVTLKGERIAEEFQQIVEDYVKARYGGSSVAPRASRLKSIPIRAS